MEYNRLAQEEESYDSTMEVDLQQYIAEGNILALHAYYIQFTRAYIIYTIYSRIYTIYTSPTHI